MQEFMQLVEDWKGFISLSDLKRPEGYDQRLKETIDLLSNANHLAPHRHKYLLEEAMTTSDFPYLFGDVLDRQVLAAYKAVDPIWKVFVRPSTVPRIYPQVGGYRFAITGGDQYLAQVGQKGEYLASSRSEERYPVYVRKYGRQFDISWEALINDDLGALKDTPERFSRAAVRTEHRLVTTVYAGDVGAHAANANLYEVGVNCVATALTIASLETALETQAALTDAAGEPILNRPKFLVVPPALEMTARQILTSTHKSWHYGGDDEAFATAGPMPTTNVLPQMGLTLVVDPYLPIIDTVSDQEGWYLFSDPKDIAAIEVNRLVGHERPEICMKASDKVNIGGGELSALTGDFASDNVYYRVRLVFGADPLDWRATYMGGYQG